MNVRHLSFIVRQTCIAVPLVLCQLYMIAVANAQAGEGISVGGRTTKGRIIVFLRDPTGEPLVTPALVRLYSADGIPIGQASVSSGGQAIFQDLANGSYTIEAEASGYDRAHAEAMLPMTGDANVDIYLHRESDSEPVVLSDPGLPVLAPKAKRELNLGLEALRDKDLDKAQKHLGKAYEMAPSHPEVLYLLGSLYSQKNDLPQAEELLAKSAQIDPGYAPAQAALGIILSNEHKCRAALGPLEKALELDAKSWEARWALARCEYSHRNFQAALQHSKQALQDSNGLGPDIALVVAASQAALGQYEECALALREYVQQHPDRPGVMRARRWLGRLQQAGKIKSK
ncbi:MAG TPA: tetratricopeptide repeat protein [Candidatus Dormibacteraeota bacterium]|nr:tetratricopeptide repeat protein [Candidatus Dormibacteraeota bacterium]